MNRRPLRRAATIPFLLVAVLGCGSAAPRGASDSPLSLHVGEKAQVQGGELVLTFVGVTEDSRCPKGEQCIHAGRARLSFEAAPRGGSPVAFELDTSRESETEVGRYRVSLLSLEPVPVAGRSIDPADYVAKLSVH